MAAPNSLLDALMVEVEAQAESQTQSAAQPQPAHLEHDTESLNNPPAQSAPVEVEPQDDSEVTSTIVPPSLDEKATEPSPTIAIPGLMAENLVANNPGSVMDTMPSGHEEIAATEEQNLQQEPDTNPLAADQNNSSSHDNVQAADIEQGAPLFPSSHDLDVPTTGSSSDEEKKGTYPPPAEASQTGEASESTLQGTEVMEDVDSSTRTAEANTTTVASNLGNQADVEFVIPPTAPDATMDMAPAEGGEGAEWEVDSSPYQSSDSDSSDTTSSEDEDGDYAMLDPEEAARILMQGDGGSDDEGGGSKDKSGGTALRTANERFEEIIPKPDITITEEMAIEELGHVEFIVENTVVIKAKTSGEYQVLETNSLLCLKDRTVLGVVADLIGRVEEPRYTLRFTNDQAIQEAGVSVIGTEIYYSPQHSTFVFTQPLKGVKGSDASNFHDEEVGDDEMEFSDDEAEAEHKRNLKMKRQGRAAESGRGRGVKSQRGANRGGRGGRNDRGQQNNPGANDFHTPEMNYDDVSNPGGGDDEYTPLQRPSNLFEMMVNGPSAMQHPLPPPPPPSAFPPNRGDFGGRGRGSNRGGRGQRQHHQNRDQRGGMNQSGGPSWNQTNNNRSSSSHNDYPFQNASVSHPPQLFLPTTPSLPPHSSGYQHMSPSPITPLPNSSFNFTAGFQPHQNYPYMNPQIPGLSAPVLQQIHQQFQQHQQQQQQQQQHTNQYPQFPPMPQQPQQGQPPNQYQYQNPNQNSSQDPNQNWGRR
ncbi:hypothetical protein PV10_02560 [Exophiala mesophila]|uniref:H/ACA ribonucleoprotein complex non-core subunit NAF1 n=1 Tax=Exophiala mesophila TaxID=212818 RepID=A0A0D2A729_EXOME|nr:uncharacterized protein PV10_02560 [Exophiala mesophila]KIV94828.1 hypothetical protein PV10_02560 [Exophiala mesophila]